MPPKLPKRVPYKSHDQLEKDLIGFYGMIGMAVMAFDMTDGMIIMSNAEKLGQSVNNVAKHNKGFRDTIVRLMQVSIYGALISAHATVAIAIMQNHDMLPPLGTVGPSNLDRAKVEQEEKDKLAREYGFSPEDTV